MPCWSWFPSTEISLSQAGTEVCLVQSAGCNHVPLYNVGLCRGTSQKLQHCSLPNHTQPVLLSIHILHRPDHPELASLSRISISPRSLREGDTGSDQVAKALLCRNICSPYCSLRCPVKFLRSQEIPSGILRLSGWVYPIIQGSTHEDPSGFLSACTAILFFNENKDFKREKGKWCTNKPISTFSHLGAMLQVEVPQFIWESSVPAMHKV